MSQATDPADRSGVIPTRDASVHVLTSGEIDSSKVEVGAYVEITYYKGEKRETTRGYIKAVDSETLTIGRGLWQEQIAFERIQKLIAAKSDREIDSLKKRADTLSVKKENRRGAGLMFEVGWNQGINTSDRWQELQEGRPWSLSYYFGRMVSGKRSQRFGVKYTRQVVEVGETYWSSSLLLMFQYVVQRNRRIVMLADLAMGIVFLGPSCEDSDWIWICLPEMGSRYSAGMALLLPVHAGIGLQATVRADLLSINDRYPFSSGMSVTFGLLYEID